MKKLATVYWLLPAKPERELFRKIIRILGKEFGGPNFEPHLTLFVTASIQHSPRKVLQQIRAQPLRLVTCRMAFSDKFTKSLFVRFKPDRALHKLTAELGRAAKVRTKPPKDPHISLLYKKIPRASKRELAKMIELPVRTVAFDSLAAVRLTLPVRTAADVHKWKVVAKKKFSR